MALPSGVRVQGVAGQRRFRESHRQLRLPGSVGAERFLAARLADLDDHASRMGAGRGGVSPELERRRADDREYLAVTGNYFSVLGMRATAGRPLFPADDVPDSATAVVSEGFWKNRSPPTRRSSAARYGSMTGSTPSLGLPIGNTRARLPRPAVRSVDSADVTEGCLVGSDGTSDSDLRDRLAAGRTRRARRGRADRYAAIEADLSSPARRGIQRSKCSAD